METFRELKITGERPALDSLFAAVDKSLAPGWTRDHEAEESLRGEQDIRAYRAPPQGERPAATIFFFFDDDRPQVRVTNIVPVEVGSLTTPQYNEILHEFFSRYLQPAARGRTDCAMELTSDVTTGAEILGAESYELLRRFSLLANKGTGSGHPLDQARWFAFLYAVHKGGKKVDSGMLDRILTEELDWSERIASRLVSEYEFAIRLLRHGC